MTPEAILADLIQCGIEPSVTPDKTGIVVPAGKLTEAQRAAILGHKPALIACILESARVTAQLLEAAMRRCDQFNDSDLIKYATEIRVRAQRRAGEMLAQTPKATGAAGIGPIAVTAGNRNQPAPATLEEIGVTKKQSSNWQALASMTEEHFEATVEAAKDTAGEVTTAFMLREAKKGRPPTLH